MGARNPALIAFKVDPSGTGLNHAWDADLDFSDAPGSPLVVADPTGQSSLIWLVGNPTILRALDIVKMTLDFHSDAFLGNDVGLCPHFAPITATGKSVFVDTDSGVVTHVNVPLTYKLILVSNDLPTGRS